MASLTSRQRSSGAGSERFKNLSDKHEFYQLRNALEPEKLWYANLTISRCERSFSLP
jgi:hypothetical protein